MKSKTIIIDSDKVTSNKLAGLMKIRMPNLELIGKAANPKESKALLRKEKPQILFVNILHLSAKQFLELKQIKNSNCSIIFITPAFMEENLKYLPQNIFKRKDSALSGIHLKVDNYTSFFSFSNIIRLQSNSNYTTFYLLNRSSPVVSTKTLKYYVNQFNKSQFLRPHRSHLVNKAFIKSYSKKEQLIILTNGTNIQISRRRRAEILNDSIFRLKTA